MTIDPAPGVLDFSLFLANDFCVIHRVMKSKKKKTKKQQFSSVKALLKADREREIETYGKQVSMRPSRVHKSKKDYDRKKNKVQERDLE